MRRLALLLTLAAFGPAFAQGADPSSRVQDTMAQRMQACVVCHGPEGVATNAGYFPRIAGKPAGYLHQQLQNFQSGRRRYTAMNHLVAHMSDDYLQAIAQYFSALDLPYPPAQATALSPEQARAAQALVQQGAPERQIPACTACHGERMAGKLPAMPGLLTLPADYLVAQFGAWRTGQRQAKAPDCMAHIAQRLTVDEIGIVARWLSAQTLPTGTKPEAANPAALPMPCGSGQ
ncbi:MAG TPA: c-type cytochrome [Rhizobacter sp.]